MEATTSLDLPFDILADVPKNTTSEKSAEETPKCSLRSLKKEATVSTDGTPVCFLFYTLSKQAISYSVFLSLSAVEPPLKKGGNILRSSMDLKPPVPNYRTPKNCLTLHPNIKLALTASCTASPHHQVNDNDEMSGLGYKVIGSLEHPPKVGRTADSENISNVTNLLHSKHHNTPDDRSLNKKPRTKSLESTSPQMGSDPKNTIESDTIPLFDQITPPTITFAHSKAARILDTNCTQRKIEFHNSNWPIVCHFYTTQIRNSDEVLQVFLLNCSHNVSFNSTVINEIVFNYSKSVAVQLSDSKNMSKSDSDMKAFLAYMDC